MTPPPSPLLGGGLGVNLTSNQLLHDVTGAKITTFWISRGGEEFRRLTKRQAPAYIKAAIQGLPNCNSY